MDSSSAKRGRPLQHVEDASPAKRGKTGSGEMRRSQDVLVIDDDDDDVPAFKNHSVPHSPSSQQQQQQQQPSPSMPLGALQDFVSCWARQDRSESLVQHLIEMYKRGHGVEPNDALNSVAQEYLEAQTECDALPIDMLGSLGQPMVLQALVRKERCRRAFMHLYNRREMPPGTPTFEPGFISPPNGGPGQPTTSHHDMPVQPLPHVDNDPEASPDASMHLSTPVPPSQPVTVPAPPVPITQPTLCPEQAAIVELAAAGRNIFYTGSAGCGKSTVLHAIVARLRDLGKTVRVMAPTGKVALAIGGTTTWTFAGWTPDAHKQPLKILEAKALGKRIWKRFNETDVIVIDEISMVENLHFERLNMAMKAGCGKEEAFGGVQVIVTGDFCQLPPVKPFQHCITCGMDLKPDSRLAYACPKCGKRWEDSEKWAFQSQAWQECQFEHIHLKTIHRQNDKVFIKMLQKCRLGIPFSTEEERVLMYHKTTKSANAVKLFSTRDEVRRTNDTQYQKLRDIECVFQSHDLFRWEAETGPELQYKGEKNPDGSLRALNDHRFDARCCLKKGTLVVLLVNLSLEEGLCNGSQGIVCGWEEYDPAKLPRKTNGKEGSYDTDGPGRGGGIVDATKELIGEHAKLRETEIRRFMERRDGKNTPTGARLWPVVQFLNGRRRTIYAECQVHQLGDQEPYSLLCRTQIPLAPAWALSIHRAQGMTLDRVVVDLSKAFEVGQAYVALSRATSLDGLRVEGNVEGLRVGNGGNQEVREFLQEKFGDLRLIQEAG